MVNQPEHMVVDKEGTKVGVADVAVSNDSNIRNKDQENHRTPRVGESSWKGCGQGGHEWSPWSSEHCDSQVGGVAPAEALTHLLRRVQLWENLHRTLSPPGQCL